MKIRDVLFEFAPGGGGDSGDYLRALASAWYNGVFNTGSLPRGIKTQEDIERLLNRGIVCPDGKTRKLHIDYNSDFDGVEIYSDDYYEHGDESGELDSRTGQPFGPYDHMEFKDEELDEGVAEGLSKQFEIIYLDQSGERKRKIVSGTSKESVARQFKKQYKLEIEQVKQLQQGVAEGIETVHGKKYSVDPDKYYVWAWDGAAVLYGEYDDIQDAKINLPRIEQRAIKRLGPFAKGKFEIASGKDLLRRYEKSDTADGRLNEFAPDGNDGGEEDALHKYARMWWAGDEATQMQIERALAKMGWEIGEDEGSYDNGGVFVVRAGDVNGRSYQSWPAEELDEGMWDAVKKSFTPDPNWQKRAGQAAGHIAQGAVAGAAHGHPVGHAMADTGVHESDDPWGSPGRYVGDTGPAQLTTTVAKVQLKPGDQVLYKTTEQRARIEALSRDGTKARIHIATPMGGRIFNCKTADLKALSRGLADEGATVTTTPGSAEPGGAVDNFKQQMANRTEIDYLKNLAGIKEGRDLCNVCGQTPCNCTHLSEEFDLIESIVEKIAVHNGVDVDMIWEDLESLSDDELYVFAVTSEPIMEDWQKVNKQDRTSGMSRKAVNAYRREHPGSKLKTAVTTKPSKLKRGSKASKRRKSYCSRSRGQMKMHNISCAKTPDKAICKARRRWNC